MLLLLSFVGLLLGDVSRAEPSEIQVPKKLMKKLKSFEPSGLVSLDRGYTFLLASDDTDENDTAMLFLMDSNGEVSKRPIYWQGLETMTDIESLSFDGRFLYALSSLSLNKKGKLLPERNLIARGVLNSGEMESVEWMDLRTPLIDALKASKDSRLSKLSSLWDQKLEIESSQVVNGNLVVGLKEPLSKEGKALVLDLGNVDQLFRQKKPGLVTVFAEISLPKGFLLSELLHLKSGWWIAATSEDKGGLVSHYLTLEGNALKTIQYKAAKPEGLSEAANGVMVVFDQKDEPGLFENIEN